MSLNTLGIIKNGTKIKIPAVFVPEPQESVYVTANGSKTKQTLLNELYALIDRSKLSLNSFFVVDGQYGKVKYSLFQLDADGTIACAHSYVRTTLSNATIFIRSSNSQYKTASGTTVTDESSQTESNGTKYVFYY